MSREQGTLPSDADTESLASRADAAAIRHRVAVAAGDLVEAALAHEQIMHLRSERWVRVLVMAEASRATRAGGRR